MVALRARQRLGKYKIQRKIAEGGFASVYQALDTIEGIRVALKVPHPHLLSPSVLEDFRREVRLAAKLDHPNILPVKDASMIENRFVVALPLGKASLDDRLRSRMSARTALGYAEQIMAAVAFAHRHRIMHCDIKPDNVIFDSQGRLRLTDFGVAKVAQKTISGSGSGTVGHIAPEQAMGRPSLRSDVFSLGLIVYRMLSGQQPEWPYDWPPEGYQKLRRRVHPDLIALLKRAMAIDPRKRFRDADQMLAAFRRLKRRALSGPSRRRRRPRAAAKTRHWLEVRQRQFKAQYGKKLRTHFLCRRCEGPVSEAMRYCPWCGAPRRVHRQETSLPARCPRCKRGTKLDWRFCPWCWGKGLRKVSDRTYTDRRYEARCGSPVCDRRDLMPFMRYCPWCHRKVRRRWKVPGSDQKCPSCGWGVVADFWNYCPWCGKRKSGH
ncbi:MAG TPA: serine/threonine-protein kinase [Phycisphaerae bacterium]|nr:serine/threonine-protein kinase [Phycisphaerae bacterium]